jgi:acetylglutamate kinase
MKNIFIKVSGDLYKNDSFLEFVSNVSKDSYAVICVGGGTQINAALEAKGFTLSKHGPLGRELGTLEEKQIARDVLEQNQNELQNILIEKRIVANVVIPVLDMGTVTCHVNGDEMLKAVYLGFDKLYVITLADRVLKKEEQFKELPKIEIVGL